MVNYLSESGEFFWINSTLDLCQPTPLIAKVALKAFLDKGSCTHS